MNTAVTAFVQPLATAAAWPDDRPQVRPAAVASIAGQGLSVIRTAAQFEALAPEWLALETEADGAQFFQSAGWARAIFAFEAARDTGRFDPIIVALRQNGRLRAVLPLERLGGALRILVPLGDGFAQFTDLLCAPDLDTKAAVDAMLAAAIKAAPCDLVSLHKVRSDGHLVAGLSGAVQTGEALGAPFERLTDWADFEGYFASIRPKTRKNMRSGRNRLEREGPLEHRIALGDAAIGAVVARIVAGRANRLKEQGLTSRAFADRDFAGFCAGLAGAAGIEVMALSLCRDGEPLSEQWGFVHGGRYYIFMTSRDFGSSEESPGKLQMKDVMQASFARGIRTVDFMTPIMPYKQTWCRQLAQVRDYAIPVTPKGWLRINLWDRRARPRLKRVVNGLPKPLRTALLRLVGKTV
ncbi:GNAT family N-acetyltransferase [uncultured Devosia sp.]|uniref:GNAT family N-acetyltransferase n=1 Tax=uncultured Devosia sp. TaxID=211434 RepID=UPI0035CB0EC0